MATTILLTEFEVDTSSMYAVPDVQVDFRQNKITVDDVRSVVHEKAGSGVGVVLCATATEFSLFDVQPELMSRCTVNITEKNRKLLRIECGCVEVQADSAWDAVAAAAFTFDAPDQTGWLRPANWLCWLYQYLLPLLHDVGLHPDVLHVTVYDDAAAAALLTQCAPAVGLLLRSVQSCAGAPCLFTSVESEHATCDQLLRLLHLSAPLSPLGLSKSTVSKWLLSQVHDEYMAHREHIPSFCFTPNLNDIKLRSHAAAFVQQWPTLTPCSDAPESCELSPCQSVPGTSYSTAHFVHTTCVAYDQRMGAHCDVEPHPECPQRIQAIYTKLESSGLLSRCAQLPGTSATHEQLSLVHDVDYIESIMNSSTMSTQDRRKMAEKFNSIFLNDASYECALMSAGTVLSCVDQVLRGDCANGFAVVRPPGHHAEADKAYGFCIFDNVAIAAKYAQRRYNVRKVLIVDWDVHHGNGVQNAFWEDPSVMYISLHRYDHGMFFPIDELNSCDDLGEADGVGYTMNFAWNERRRPMCDADYIQAFNRVLLPVAHSFQPDLVLVSCGFDAARGDPLGGYSLSPECYGWMTRQLQVLAGGKLVLALEGGYNLESISNSAVECVRALLGDCIHRMDDTAATNVTNITWDTLRYLVHRHRQYWPVLQPCAHRLWDPVGSSSTSPAMTSGDSSYDEQKRTTDESGKSNDIDVSQSDSMASAQTQDSVTGDTDLERLLGAMDSLHVGERTPVKTSAGKQDRHNTPRRRSPRNHAATRRHDEQRMKQI